MKKLILALGIILLILLAYSYSVNWDYVTSVIPGWNTTVFPIWIIVLLFAVPILVIVVLIKFFKVIIRRK